MRRHSVLVGAAFLLAAPAVAHATPTPAPPAPLSPADNDFVDNLAGQGITGDPAQLISTAHTVCTTGNQGIAGMPAGLGRMVPAGYVLSSLRLNMNQVNQFMDAAHAAYCPPPAPPAPPPDGAAPLDAPGAPTAPAPVPAPSNFPAPDAALPVPALPGGIGIPGISRLASVMGGG